MTKKGLKMNITKCLKQYDYKKSEELTTEIRGQHEFTNGYKFLDMESEIALYWHDDKMDFEERLKITKEIYSKLEKHGFTDYIKFHKNIAQIELLNFVD